MSQRLMLLPDDVEKIHSCLQQNLTHVAMKTRSGERPSVDKHTVVFI
jgi:hypothetical protein